MATIISPVTAQVELMPTGVLNFTILRSAPTGGTLTSVSAYLVRLSATSIPAVTFLLTPALIPSESTITRQILLSDVVASSGLTPDTPGLAINIKAIAGDTTFTDSDWWAEDRPFPGSFSVSTSLPSIKVGDLVTISPPSDYSGDYSRIKFVAEIEAQDAAVEWKTFIKGMEFSYIFRSIGSHTSSITVSSDIHSVTTGSSFLLRTSFLTTTVIAGPSISQTGLHSWIGTGDSTGFTFTDASAANYTSGTYSVILYGAAIASRNKEVKMFLATSRSADANTYYQTLAWDIFPVPGRYKVPSHNPSVNITFDATRAYTDASLYAPLKLTGMQIPVLQVGYEYDIELEAQGGLQPYAYYASDIPNGMTLTSNGRLIGSPTASGLFQSSVSVIDSEYPPQVDAKTLNLYIQTDLAILPVSYQHYYIGRNALTSVQATGGIAPYKWQVIGGNESLAEYGLAFSSDMLEGTISGLTYDIGSEHLPYQFPVTLQVIDAVGSSATTTIQAGIFPPKLKLAKEKFDEFLDGEYCSQQICALGGDSINYIWSLSYVDGPRDSTGAIITPSPGLISLTNYGIPGSPNIALLSYDPTAYSTTQSIRTPENFYRVKVSVSSGGGNYQESDSQFYDLIISPSLADAVISNDKQLPLAYPGTPYAVQLNSFPVDAGASYFTQPIGDLALPGYLSINPATGLISESLYTPIPANANKWFRVFLKSGLRTYYFKDFHFQSSNSTAGFSLHVDNSYLDSSGSTLVAIGHQYTGLCLQSNDSCVSLRYVNSINQTLINNVALYRCTGTLPKGVSFSSMGYIYGTPTEFGRFDCVISATTATTATTAGSEPAWVELPITILVNAASAQITDLIHDVRYALDQQSVVTLSRSLTSNTSFGIPSLSTPYSYGEDATFIADVYNPNSDSEESYTYSWNLSGLANNSIPEANAVVLGNPAHLTPSEQIPIRAFWATAQSEKAPLDALSDSTFGSTSHRQAYDAAYGLLNEWKFVWDGSFETIQDISGWSPSLPDMWVTYWLEKAALQTEILNIQRTRTVTLYNNSRAIQSHDVSVTATDNLSYSSDMATISFRVDTHWLRTASYTYDTTTLHAPDESLTDGITIASDSAYTHIDLLGS